MIGLGVPAPLPDFGVALVLAPVAFLGVLAGVLEPSPPPDPLAEGDVLVCWYFRAR